MCNTCGCKGAETFEAPKSKPTKSSNDFIEEGKIATFKGMGGSYTGKILHIWETEKFIYMNVAFPLDPINIEMNEEEIKTNNPRLYNKMLMNPHDRPKQTHWGMTLRQKHGKVGWNGVVSVKHSYNHTDFSIRKGQFRSRGDYFTCNLKTKPFNSEGFEAEMDSATPVEGVDYMNVSGFSGFEDTSGEREKIRLAREMGVRLPNRHPVWGFFRNDATDGKYRLTFDGRSVYFPFGDIANRRIMRNMVNELNRINDRYNYKLLNYLANKANNFPSLIWKSEGFDTEESDVVGFVGDGRQIGFLDAENDPDFDEEKADRNKDGKISDWERAVGNAVAKSIRENKSAETFIKSSYGAEDEPLFPGLNCSHCGSDLDTYYGEPETHYPNGKPLPPNHVERKLHIQCNGCGEASKLDEESRLNVDESSPYFYAETRNRYGNRYITRDSKGKFKKNVSVGRSLKADRRRKAKRVPKSSGQGDKGDYNGEDMSLKDSAKLGFGVGAGLLGFNLTLLGIATVGGFLLNRD